jgi:ankyrin repeat protein
VACVDVLLSAAPHVVDSVDRNGCTALFYATTLGYRDCVTSLLHKGANPNHVDNRGRRYRPQLFTTKLIGIFLTDVQPQNKPLK